jgi:ribonuclease-3
MKEIVVFPLKKKMTPEGEIQVHDVHQILSRYDADVPIRDITLFQRAFVHRSHADRCYEELEFFGDSVLGLICVLYMNTRFPGRSEGFYTKLKSKLVNGSSLSVLARKNSFHRHIKISKEFEEKSGRFSEKILEDVFEAFIGALFLDQKDHMEGYQVCYRFLYNMFDNINHDFDYSHILLYDTNYKEQIMKMFHSKKWGSPVYKEISTESTLTNKIFTVGVVDPSSPGSFFATGVGTTKKRAEQTAAKEALRKMDG